MCSLIPHAAWSGKVTPEPGLLARRRAPTGLENPRGNLSCWGHAESPRLGAAGGWQQAMPSSHHLNEQ